MMNDYERSLPFKSGHVVESKSFQKGYRSAWFRCKIEDICSWSIGTILRLEYFDYPDEKLRWVKLYQKPHKYPTYGSGLKHKAELMIRPQYPPVYYESEVPDSLPSSDLIVIINYPWKVGDLVDWWCDGCFWSGKITKIMGNDKVQVKLPDPPVGQGCFYEALCKDLRPSLNWSPESGWVVPVSGKDGNERYCARLNCLHEQDTQTKGMDIMGTKDSGMLEGTAESAPHASCSQDEQKYELEEFSNSPPGEHQNSLDLKEKTGIASRKYLMAARSSASLDSAIMNLEELTCKIKWLKGLLKFGFQWSDSMKPSWQFLENRGMHPRR